MIIMLMKVSCLTKEAIYKENWLLQGGGSKDLRFSLFNPHFLQRIVFNWAMFSIEQWTKNNKNVFALGI